jgi:hypothetical protein
MSEGEVGEVARIMQASEYGRRYREAVTDFLADPMASLVDSYTTDGLKPCPVCGSPKSVFMHGDPVLQPDLYAGYFLTCGDCRHEGPVADQACCAFAAWGIEGLES